MLGLTYSQPNPVQVSYLMLCVQCMCVCSQVAMQDCQGNSAPLSDWNYPNVCSVVLKMANL